MKTVKDLKIGTRLEYVKKGIFGWEEIDEPDHAGIFIGKTCTVDEIDDNDNSITFEETGNIWFHIEHFELAKD